MRMGESSILLVAEPDTIVEPESGDKCGVEMKSGLENGVEPESRPHTLKRRYQNHKLKTISYAMRLILFLLSTRFLANFLEFFY